MGIKHIIGDAIQEALKSGKIDLSTDEGTEEAIGFLYNLYIYITPEEIQDEIENYRN